MTSEDLADLLNERMTNKLGGNNQRLALMLGWLTKGKGKLIQANIPDKDRSQYSQERYKFMLNAPFEICNLCCNVMKKNPSHEYNKETDKKPITAQLAEENRLRTQKWLENGCNGFEMKNPMSVPMAFWTEQDVLQYIKEHDLKMASVYGEIVHDEGVDGQISLFDFGLCEQCGELKTTGCRRTGCIMCAFGLFLEKGENRFDRLHKTHQKIFDYIMRGGCFSEEGLWKPSNDGLGYWFIIQWINIHGGFKAHIENYEYYEKKYGNEQTRRYLYGE